MQRLDHLSSATGAYGAFSWTYDAAGNRLTQNAAGTAATYSYAPKSNVLTKLVQGTLTTTVATSAAGNTLTVTPSTGSAVSRTYNKAERLVGVVTGTTQTATYTYDAFGQRFGKVVGTANALFQYDQSGRMLEKTSNTGALSTDTLYLNGAPIAEITPTALFYIHTDRLGTPQVATTTAGAVAWRAAYQPFGVNTGATGLLSQNLRFPGQYADSETGDYQAVFRVYDPTLGEYFCLLPAAARMRYFPRMAHPAPIIEDDEDAAEAQALAAAIAVAEADPRRMPHEDVRA